MTVQSDAAAARAMSVGAAVRHMGAYVRPYRGRVLLLVGTLLIEVAYDTSLLLSLRFLIDRAIVPQNGDLLVLVGAALTGGFLLTVLVQLLRDYHYAALTSRVLRDLRVAMFRHLQRVPLAFYARTGTGDLVARFSTDLAAIESAFVNGAFGALLSVLNIVAGGAALIYLDWRLAAVALGGIPLVMLGPRIFGGRAVGIGAAARGQQAQLVNLVQENVGAQPFVRAFDLGEAVAGRFVAQADVLRGFVARFNFLSNLTERSPNIAMAALTLVVLSFGAFLAFTGSLSVGALAAAFALFGHVSNGVRRVTLIAPTVLRATGAMQRVQAVLDEPAATEAAAAPALPRLDGEIAFRNVSFGYSPERKVLDQVSFTIGAGERVAIVGPSGCGKSTVLDLLLRLHDPAQGQVLIDGIDLGEAKRASWYAQIGTVFQDSYLFDGTIADNIRIARPSASDEEIVAAARDADLHTFVTRELPLGYATRVGERGSNLSGGQRQRVAIARALLRDPAVLFLDEATSALDPETEAAINQTMDRVADGRTVIAVTHRLATITEFDRVLVLSAGRLVEQGTFQELAAAEGLFAHMWAKQSGLSISSDQARVRADWLRRIDLFHACSASKLEELADAFQTERVGEGRRIIAQGEVGDRFYILVHGKLDVLVQDATDAAPRRIGVLVDGDHFGEVALLEHVPRVATVRSTTPCILLSLHKERFEALLAQSPGLADSMLATHRARAAGPRTAA